MHSNRRQLSPPIRPEKPCYRAVYIPVLVFLGAAAASNAVAGETDLRLNVAWEAFLARHDLVWKAAPTDYFDAPFVGN